MNVLILEDETLAAERLNDLLIQIESEINIVGTIKSVEASLLWLDQNPEPELIISDIQLLDSVAFDIFQQRKVNCPIIFTTAYDQYAIQAFEVNSIDYLLKPIQKVKLKTAIEKFKLLKSNPGANVDDSQLTQLMEFIKNQQQQYKTRFMIKLGQKIKAIPTKKIAYFYSRDKLTYIITDGNDKFPIDLSLEEVDGMLDPNSFFRINRKFIVRIEAIKEIHPYFKGRLKLELLPDTKEGIVISSEKTPAFKAWLDK